LFEKFVNFLKIPKIFEICENFEKLSHTYLIKEFIQKPIFRPHPPALIL